MARVPQYSGGQVLPDVRPGTRVQSGQSMEAATLPGRNLQAIGKGLGEVAGVAGEYAAKEQDKINKVRFNDAYNQALNEANRLKAEYSQQVGAEAVKGVNGRPLKAHYGDELRTALSGIANGLTAPDLKDGFSLAANELEGKFLREVENWEVEQGAVYANQVRDATVIESFNQVMTNPSSPIAAAHLARARDAVTEKLTDAGFDGEALDQQVKTALSQGHTSVIDQLNEEGRFDEAEAYFERHKSDYMQADARAMRTAIDEQNRELKTMARADKIWEASGGDYGKALDAVREVADPRDRNALEARIGQMKTQDDAAKSAKDATDLEAGMAYVVAGQPVPAAWRREASPIVVDRIQAEQRTRALWAQQMATSSAEERRAMKEISGISKDYFKGIAALDPEAYMAPRTTWDADMTAVWDSLMPEHQAEIAADIANRKASGQTFDALDKTFKDLVAQVPVLGPENMKAKNLATGSQGKAGKRTFTDEEKVVRGSLYRQAQEHAARSGGAPITSQDSKVMIARAFREADPTRYPYPEPGRFVDPFVGAIAGTPVYQETVAYLAEKLERQPTDEEVRAAIDMMRAEP